ncbi:hypothetical protein EXO80_24775 [Salmonella enterica]|nr:hypothetical protein [Salmonella enterica]ECH1726074.1 hypothetical protein [Salmonella enterica]
MATIQPRGKTPNKRYQFSAPTEIVDEFMSKKEQLEAHELAIDLTDDFVKVLKDAIKMMDKRLTEVKESQNTSNITGANSLTNA